MPGVLNANMAKIDDIPDYSWSTASAQPSHEVLLPAVLRTVGSLGKNARLLDLGCGNGYVAHVLSDRGLHVVGADISSEGLRLARAAYPTVPFVDGSVYDEQLLAKIGGPVDVVLSLEVLEHLFQPRALFRQARRVLTPNGRLIISTPYHGYLKNLLIAVAGRWDRHANPCWDGGHVKLFSRRTLIEMAKEEGFRETAFVGVGRIPFLWRSMVVEFVTQ